MSRSQLMPDSLRHDWLGLTALIEATAHRQTVPCVNGTEIPRGHWTSDATAEQAAAAKECGKCSVLAQCAEYGVSHPQESGVLGSMTERHRAKAARDKTKREAGK